MTFIVFDNHTVSANTTDAVQESESTNSSATSIQKKALTLKTSATSTSDVSTADTTSTSSSATNDATNNEANTTSTATSTAATSTSEESTSSQNNQVVNSTTVEPTNNATMNSTDNLEKNKVAPSIQKEARRTTIPTHTTTSSTDANGFTLSIDRTTVGNDGDAGKDLNISGYFLPGIHLYY